MTPSSKHICSTCPRLCCFLIPFAVSGQHAEEISLCACSAYILTGMAVVAMCFSLVQEEVANLLRLIGATCGKANILKPRDDEQIMSVSSWQRPKTEGAPPIVKTPPVIKKLPPLLQHNSLPRKTNFQRNTPARRSAGRCLPKSCKTLFIIS